MSDGNRYWWINDAMNSYRKVLGPYAWCVYDFLCSRVRTTNKPGENHPLQECWVQQTVIAKELGISVSAVKLGLKKLEDHELIDREPPKAFGQRNHYVLLKVKPLDSSVEATDGFVAPLDSRMEAIDSRMEATADSRMEAPLKHLEEPIHQEEVKQEEYCAPLGKSPSSARRSEVRPPRVSSSRNAGSPVVEMMTRSEIAKAQEFDRFLGDELGMPEPDEPTLALAAQVCGGAAVDRWRRWKAMRPVRRRSA